MSYLVFKPSVLQFQFNMVTWDIRFIFNRKGGGEISYGVKVKKPCP